MKPRFSIISVKSDFLRRLYLILFIFALMPILFVFGLILGYLAIKGEVKPVFMKVWKGSHD